MSEPQSEPQSPEPGPGPLAFDPEVEFEKPAGAASRRRRLPLPKRRGGRWALGAAAVVVLGVAATAAGVALHHPERGRPMYERGFAHRVPGAPEAPGAPGAYGRPGTHQDGLPGSHQDGRRTAHRGAEGGGAANLAPAALPAVPADQALAKAAGAVPGGKPDALSVVGREGGGSSWAVEVLGADGVRHLVTVDGADGSITGNTVVNGR
ncbi:PepSY domain-containing protein [Kitasatospora griseola]|uniref:PepSY domain-containing protein n=1 Tax=Kitasatospora griseola TaxID=2064 RepID=UPI00341E0BE0